jgi:hypothetical protein
VFQALYFNVGRYGNENAAIKSMSDDEERNAVMTRDPRTDPQPGDELRDTGQIRRVVKREGERILVEGPRTRYWMRLDRWRRWCEKSGAGVAESAKPEG